MDKQLSSNTDSSLAENVRDPRTLDKLMDGYYHTCDELHSWLVPFQEGNEYSTTLPKTEIIVQAKIIVSLSSLIDLYQFP